MKCYSDVNKNKLKADAVFIDWTKMSNWTAQSLGSRYQCSPPLSNCTSTSQSTGKVPADKLLHYHLPNGHYNLQVSLCPPNPPTSSISVTPWHRHCLHWLDQEMRDKHSSRTGQFLGPRSQGTPYVLLPPTVVPLASQQVDCSTTTPNRPSNLQAPVYPPPNATKYINTLRGTDTKAQVAWKAKFWRHRNHLN